MHSIINTLQRSPDLLAALVAGALLAGAFGFQAAGYHPCEMCWWQRYPYMVIVGLVVLARVVKLNIATVIWLCAILFAVDAAIAGFHVGVEQKWWEGMTECTSQVSLDGNLDDALNAIMNAPLVRCDEIAWSLFGISMAGYNFLIAAGMTIFMVRTAGKRA